MKPIEKPAEIRPVQASETALLAALQAACFGLPSPTPDAAGDEADYVGESWSARSWAEVLAMPGSFALLAIAGDEPVGFLAAQVLFEDCELLSLGVLPSCRRAGYGRRLLDRGLGEAGRRGAAQIQLEVAEKNRRGRTFYETQGFTVVGRRKGYYPGPEGAAIDALILRRSLGIQ